MYFVRGSLKILSHLSILILCMPFSYPFLYLLPANKIFVNSNYVKGKKNFIEIDLVGK